MSGPEQAATVTPGQAPSLACVAFTAWQEHRTGMPADDHWLALSDEARASWDAAVYAVIDAKPGSERVAELVTEANELRALLGEIKAVALWDGTHQTKIRRVLELLGVFDPQPEAVVTAGTEHLAEKIRGLAIPDEES